MIPERARRAGPARRLALVAAAALGLCVLVRVTALRRLVVQGFSMAPTLLPGDRLLVMRARHLHAGDLVAVRDPRHEERLLVKRITAITNGRLELRGDNPEASTDSREFGDVPRRLVLGRVVRRYAPPGRRGRVR